jgi:endonuclease G
VGQGNELYVICGSYSRGDTGSNGFLTTLDQGRVTVPAHCWQVVVVLPMGNNDASRVSSATRVIAVDTPNDNSLSTVWGTYRTSVDAIETATGYDLLSAVPSAVQQVVEARVDTGPTN